MASGLRDMLASRCGGTNDWECMTDAEVASGDGTAMGVVRDERWW